MSVFNEDAELTKLTNENRKVGKPKWSEETKSGSNISCEQTLCLSKIFGRGNEGGYKKKKGFEAVHLSVTSYTAFSNWADQPNQREVNQLVVLSFKLRCSSTAIVSVLYERERLCAQVGNHTYVKSGKTLMSKACWQTIHAFCHSIWNLECH